LLRRTRCALLRNSLTCIQPRESTATLLRKRAGNTADTSRGTKVSLTLSCQLAQSRKCLGALRKRDWDMATPECCLFLAPGGGGEYR
jgi:hypothetical protein